MAQSYHDWVISDALRTLRVAEGDPEDLEGPNFFVDTEMFWLSADVTEDEVQIHLRHDPDYDSDYNIRIAMFTLHLVGEGKSELQLCKFEQVIYFGSI